MLESFFFLGLDDEDFLEDFSEDPADNHVGWIQWFCALEGNEYIVEVDSEFILEPFNLKSLQEVITLPREKLRTCMRMILA